MKRAVKFFIIGLMIGILVSYLIGLFFSVYIGEVMLTRPSLALRLGEVEALALQTVLSGILGGIIGIASLIYESKLSLLSQTIIHFLVIFIPSISVSLYLEWLEKSYLLSYFLIFILIYLVIYLINYYNYKKQVKSLNRR